MLEGVKEHMFDGDSFQSEITSPSEAEGCYRYFANNLSAFRSQLSSEGKSYEEAQETIRQCWMNLLKSSQRVGYTNDHLERMAKAYGAGVNKALPK